MKGFLIWVISFFFFFCDDLPNMFVNDLPQIKKWYVLIIEIDDNHYHFFLFYFLILLNDNFGFLFIFISFEYFVLDCNILIYTKMKLYWLSN